MGGNSIKILCGAACLWAVAIAGSVQSAPYIIDPSQSFLQVAFYSQGVPVSLPQFSGSDVAALTGTIDAEVSGGQITFTSIPQSIGFSSQGGIYPDGGSGQPANGTFSALPNLPTQDPTDNIGGTQIANYGFELILPNDVDDPLNLDTAGMAGYAAIESLLASLSGSTALAGGTFSTNGLTLSLDAGHLDYNINSGNGDGPPQTSVPFFNNRTAMGANSGITSGAANGTIINVGPLMKIIVPISVDVTLHTPVTIVDAVFTGQIAAVIVPEPSSFALAGIGVAFGLPMVHRALRKLADRPRRRAKNGANETRHIV